MVIRLWILKRYGSGTSLQTTLYHVEVRLTMTSTAAGNAHVCNKVGIQRFYQGNPQSAECRSDGDKCEWPVQSDSVSLDPGKLCLT
jgi:hypothetical protein